MTILSDDFNLLPWRVRKLKIKILNCFIWHVAIVMLCVISIYLGNKYLDQRAILNRDILIKLQNTLKQMQLLEMNQFENYKLNKRHIKLQKILKKNKENKFFLNKAFKNISLAMMPHMSILKITINDSLLILNGEAHAEKELLLFLEKLNKMFFVRKAHLEQMRKKSIDGSLVFEIQAILKKPTL